MKNKMFKKLEFDMILDMLSDCALSNKVKARIDKLEPYMDEAEVLRRMEETTRARIIIETVGSPPLANMTELEKVLVLLGADAMLLPEQLNAVRQFGNTCSRMKSYLKRAETASYEVALYGQSINDITELSNEIDRCIRGDAIDDRATTQLAGLRRKIRQSGDQIKGKLDSILRSNQHCFSESFVVTRAGRYALPVKKEYRSQIKGTVIDTSKSGGTYFIEPASVTKMQEKLSMLHIDEDNEVRRILYTLTALVEDYLPLININIEAMETLDFIFAKAKLSLRMEAVPAGITTDKHIYIKAGRHPLLDKNTVVPLDFEIGRNDTDDDTVRAVVITGPNTGGKTVALKTVGLFSLMTQCGLHIPAVEGSFCMHNQVMCDIGDDQSITENLSTFSSHMTNIIRILNTADDQTLVLLDELGSGTDPMEGMGLATAILEELAKKNCIVVATTHYPEIKEFARKTEGFTNARMSFDRVNLMPLYKLEIGEAGQSCALYIAKSLGLSSSMIERAFNVAYSDERAAHKDIDYDLSHFDDIPSETQTNKIKNKRIKIKAAAQIKKELPGSEFVIGDSVMVYPLKELGLVYNRINERGEIGVQIKSVKHLINYKRIKLHVSASELYPEDYDFSIIFDSVENRKARHKMGKRHNPDLRVEITKGEY